MVIREMEKAIREFPESCRKHRKREGFTAVQIADATGLSEALISRFECGESKSPGFYNVMAYVIATKFPLMEHFCPAPEGECSDDAARLLELRAELRYLRQAVDDKNKIIESLRKSRNMVFMVFCLVLLAIIVGIVIIDLFNPYFGFLHRI